MTDFSSVSGKRLKITGGEALFGSLSVSTSKNAVLPILAASLLTQEPVTIRKIPAISDVKNMFTLLRAFGARVSISGDTALITTKSIKTTSPAANVMQRLRASILFLGPMLAREGSVTLPLPGGCHIGTRPIDLHIQGLRALGAKSVTVNGQVHVWGRPLRGAAIQLGFPSVGATENLIMAAVLAEGRTVIHGAAAEPEVCDLIRFLSAMGAKIEAGGDRVAITGVEALSGVDYTPIADRIEAGTLMLAAAVTGGEVRLLRASAAHLKPVCDKLVEAGAEIFPFEGGLTVRGRGARPMDIVSSPHPGFPTDMQAPFMAACCLAKGVSTVVETVFENRFLHVDELKKMGADITVTGTTARINGTGALHGAQVSATDLRAGAALCIAGLLAGGETVIGNIHHIDRGYENLEDKLKSLGAHIVRLS